MRTQEGTSSFTKPCKSDNDSISFQTILNLDSIKEISHQVVDLGTTHLLYLKGRGVDLGSLSLMYD